VGSAHLINQTGRRSLAGVAGQLGSSVKAARQKVVFCAGGLGPPPIYPMRGIGDETST
jgi:hypothetical protein